MQKPRAFPGAFYCHDWRELGQTARPQNRGLLKSKTGGKRTGSGSCLSLFWRGAEQQFCFALPIIEVKSEKEAPDENGLCVDPSSRPSRFGSTFHARRR